MTIAAFTSGEVAVFATGLLVGNVVNWMRSKMGEYMAQLIGVVLLLFVFSNSEVGKEFHEQYPFQIGFVFAAVYLIYVILIVSVYYEGDEEKKIVSCLILMFGITTTSLLYVLVSPVIGVIVPAEWILVLTVNMYSKQIRMTLPDNQQILMP